MRASDGDAAAEGSSPQGSLRAREQQTGLRDAVFDIVSPRDWSVQLPDPQGTLELTCAGEVVGAESSNPDKCVKECDAAIIDEFQPEFACCLTKNRLDS